jgi:ferredoxin like protein
MPEERSDERAQARAKAIEERLYADETRPDAISHLEITDPEACLECPGRPCALVCPSATYRWSEEDRRISVSFENCLECGTCRVVCPKANITWRYPMGGMGICYRYG